MKAAGMSWVTCSLLVLAASLAAATPANDRPGNKVDVAILDVHQLTPLETFSNGFPKEFAHNLPTQEFMGDFARRHKRQAGISSAIDGILSAPYGGLPVTSHLQALLLRNTNVRPARQSAASNRPAPPLSSPSLPPSPQTFSQSSPQTFSQPSPQTFSQSSPQTFSQPSPQTFSPSSPQTLSQPSPQTFSPSNGDSPQRFQPQVVRPQRQTPRFSPAPPPPSPPRRPPPSPRRPPTPPRPSTFRVIHERPAPSPPRSSPSARESPTPSQTPFSSSSFTGHQISSTFSDFGSFFESSRLPRERRDVTEEQDASAQLSQTINSPYEDAQEAREDSPGFIAGRPDSFPRFSSVGGFGPMGDLEKGNIAGNFMEEFKIPVVRIPGIREKQPQFTPLQFLNQVRDSETRHHNNLPGMNEKLQAGKTRIRRGAGEPHPSDASNVPHKRVHRVQEESQIAHARNPREFLSHGSEVAHSAVTVHPQSSQGFQHNGHQGKRTSSTTARSPYFRNKGLAPVQPSSNFKVIPDVEVHTPDDDILVPESQRFHPTITGRHSPSAPPAKESFFPSPPLPPRAPGPRRSRLLSHSPGFRGSSSQREPAAFRDFRNSFYGPGTREAIHKPEFTFPSSRRPFHREQEFGKFHNSILGSGNFEVLRGGTFYDDDDPNGFGHDYDHLLDDAYAIFPGTHSNQHSSNYVDDFFSNFRDFSEFAVRKSDEGESSFLEDSAFFGRGYASEPVRQVVDSPQPTRFNASSEEKNLNTSKENAESKVSTMETEKRRHTESNPPTAKDTEDDGNSEPRRKHRQPKNIQEVLEEIDPQPSEYSSSSLTVDDTDPMIAMF